MATLATAPPLDHWAYPHLLDRVIALASWSTKMHLRRLSRSVRDRIDASLYYHIVLTSPPIHPKYDGNRPPPGLSSIEVFAPGCRPLPPVRWEAHHPLWARMDAMRKLSYVRVVDWGLNMAHPRLVHFAADVQRAELELSAQTQSIHPLIGLLTNVEVVRYADGRLAQLPARTHVVFSNFTSSGTAVDRSAAPSHWMHWGLGIVFLPSGVERLVLHVRYDPKHPNLDGSMWELEQVLNYPLRELVIIPRPAKDIARNLPPANHLREEPVLGFLDQLLRWATVLVGRGAKVTIVGLDSMPAENLRLGAFEPAERPALIDKGISVLAQDAIREWESAFDMPFAHDRNAMANAAQLIRRVTWGEYQAETGREEYALAMVRPTFRSLPTRDYLGYPWRDDHVQIFPRDRSSANREPSHLDWLAHADGPPPLSPRPRPLDGDRCVRVSRYAGGSCIGACGEVEGSHNARNH